MAHAATIKCHGLGGLNNRHLFLIVLEAEKSNIKVPADLVHGKSPLSDLQEAVSSLCPHMLETELWSLLLSLEGH